jgi:hypothetical protein
LARRNASSNVRGFKACGVEETDGGVAGGVAFGVGVALGVSAAGCGWFWALDAAETQIKSANVENSSRYRHALALLIIVGPARDHYPQRLDQGDRNGADHRDTENSPQKKKLDSRPRLYPKVILKENLFVDRGLCLIPVSAPGDVLR